MKCVMDSGSRDLGNLPRARMCKPSRPKAPMLSIHDNTTLTFRFPDVHPLATCQVTLHRTLRVPDDGSKHRLPPSLGAFPISHVEDHAAKLPASWAKRGGVFLPMHTAEALWLSFNSLYPMAIKVAAGKINAVTGEPWSPELRGKGVSAADGKQDYLAIPQQPWLDGFCTESGVVKQFVAMPLGHGYTVEEQLTAMSDNGGLQLLVCPIKRQFYKPQPRSLAVCEAVAYSAGYSPEMGLGAGGSITQAIAEDDYEVQHYEQSAPVRCFVHLLTAEVYPMVTGRPAPTQPPSVDDYNRAGLPWFDWYDPSSKALPGSTELAGVKTVKQVALAKVEQQFGAADVHPKWVKQGPF